MIGQKLSDIWLVKNSDSMVIIRYKPQAVLMKPALRLLKNSNGQHRRSIFSPVVCVHFFLQPITKPPTACLPAFHILIFILLCSMYTRRSHPRSTPRQPWENAMNAMRRRKAHLQTKSTKVAAQTQNRHTLFDQSEVKVHHKWSTCPIWNAVALVLSRVEAWLHCRSHGWTREWVQDYPQTCTRGPREKPKSCWGKVVGVWVESWWWNLSYASVGKWCTCRHHGRRGWVLMYNKYVFYWDRHYETLMSLMVGSIRCHCGAVTFSPSNIFRDLPFFYL